MGSSRNSRPAHACSGLGPLWLSSRRSPTFLAPKIDFMKDNFSIDWDGGHGFRMIQVHFISWALFISDLTPPLILLEIPVHSLEVGDPCFKTRLHQLQD